MGGEGTCLKRHEGSRMESGVDPLMVLLPRINRA